MNVIDRDAAEIVKSSAGPVADGDDATVFMRDPAEFFGYSLKELENWDSERIEAMRLEVLKRRFNDLRGRIPVLGKLADAQGIDAIHEVDDVVPLLFEHTMYKAYPPSLLENSRFDQINKWLGKLTTHDLTKIDVSHCDTIDDWLAVMNAESPIRISHSSGTSGVMSFLPIGKVENRKYGKILQMRVWKMEGPDSPKPRLIGVQPYYRSGGSTPLLVNDDIVEFLLDGDESRMFAAFPTRMSSDILYLAARIRKARADGTLDRLKIQPALLERQKDYEAMQRDMPDRLNTFFEQIVDRHRGERIVLMGTWNTLHAMAVSGAERGMKAVFAPDSYIRSGGGAKGMVPPATWREDVCQFVGVEKIHMLYAMSEVRAAHDLCEHGHYHLSPTVIPFQLDPVTSKVLPRKGRVTGRAAFFDLGADERWGGFITGDEISVDWDTPCPCGRSGAYVFGEIQRYSEKDAGGDDKITCAASENAHNEAMDFLANFSA